MAKLSWQRIAKHSTGIPGARNGTTWNPPPLEIDEARRLLLYLENRQVLYNDIILETGNQVMSSVQGMREHLDHKLQEREIDPNSKLATIAGDMQEACRTFVNAARKHRWSSPAFYGQKLRSDAQWVAALETFRARLGRCVARLAVEYHLNVERELASILPLEGPADHI